MRNVKLELSLLSSTFAVCRLDTNTNISSWHLSGEFYSVTRTADELSIICPTDAVPEGIISEKGWKCLKLEGPFDFSAIGIVASVAVPLAQAEIGLFVTSTYDTDYVMVKEEHLEEAIEALREAGHIVEA